MLLWALFSLEYSRWADETDDTETDEEQEKVYDTNSVSVAFFNFLTGQKTYEAYFSFWYG